MNEYELIRLVESELYPEIILLAENDIEKVTIKEIEEGIYWFLLLHDKITKPQRTLIIQRIWRMFENKNKNLAAISKEKYDIKMYKIQDIEI